MALCIPIENEPREYFCAPSEMGFVAKIKRFITQNGFQYPIA